MERSFRANDRAIVLNGELKKALALVLKHKQQLLDFSKQILKNTKTLAEYNQQAEDTYDNLNFIDITEMRKYSADGKSKCLNNFTNL